MADRTIQRYEIRTILFHWVHAGLFLVLLITGFIMFLPTGASSGGYAVGVLHKVAAVIFTVLSVRHAISHPRKALTFIKGTFIWGIDDLKWFFAAPGYYFGGSPEKIPPQGHINTGQKMWQLVILITGPVLLVSGTIIWFFRSSIELATYQWILFAHGIAFVVLVVMFLVHIYMGLLHPAMRESLPSMLDGKISEEYASSHYRKWYENRYGKS